MNFFIAQRFCFEFDRIHRDVFRIPGDITITVAPRFDYGFIMYGKKKTN